MANCTDEITLPAGVQSGDISADHLILLVGGNPLPNAVTACFLNRLRPCTVWLAHSPETAPLACNLERWLTSVRSGLGRVMKRQVHSESDATIIYRDVAALVEAIPERESIGLNYTGGTKAMAVHAARAVRDARPGAVFSYLDARTSSLMFDSRVSGACSQPVPLGQTVRLELDDYLKINGYELTKAPCQTVQFLEAAQEMLCRIAEPGWRNWKRVFHPAFAAAGKKAARHEGIPLFTDKWPGLLDVTKAMGAQGNERTVGDLARGLGTKSASISAWLDGCWLEHLVLDALKSLEGKGVIDWCGQSVELKRPSTTDAWFEMDNVTIAGHRFFGISCSTTEDIESRPGSLKYKLFESAHRAEQIGGAEARTAVVSIVQSKGALENELKGHIAAGDEVKVFGRGDVEHLERALGDWFVARP